MKVQWVDLKVCILSTLFWETPRFFVIVTIFVICDKPLYVFYTPFPMMEFSNFVVIQYVLAN